jgi:ankyrin repeat protein
MICPSGIPAVVLSATLGYGRLTDKLILAGANLSREDTAKVIEAAARHGHACVTQALESVGADMTYTNPETRETLAHLVCKVDISTQTVLTILARNGVDLNHQNSVGQTCLMISCMKLRSNINITTILELGADVNIQDNEGNTAITLLSGHNIHYLSILAKLGGDIYHCNAAGKSVAHIQWVGSDKSVETYPLYFPTTYALAKACREGDLESVKYNLEILKSGSTSKHALSSLNWRVKWGLEGGEEKDPARKTVLMHAAESPMNTTWQDDDPLRAARMREIVGLLLDHGADINATDDSGVRWWVGTASWDRRGETALMKATLRKYRDMALFLLERGADWRIRGDCQLTYHSTPIRSQLGETALHIAYIRNERSIVCMIIDTYIGDENRGDAANSLRDLIDNVREMFRADLPNWSIMKSRLMWAHRRPFLLCLYQNGLRTLKSQIGKQGVQLQHWKSVMALVFQNLDIVRYICSYL